MGKVTGFKEFERKDEAYKPVEERVKHYKEFTVPLDDKEITEQGSRCMDCGIPFCHSGKKPHGFYTLQTTFQNLRVVCVLLHASKLVY